MLGRARIGRDRESPDNMDTMRGNCGTREGTNTYYNMNNNTKAELPSLTTHGSIEGCVRMVVIKCSNC